MKNMLGFCVTFLFFVPLLNLTQNSIAVRTNADGSERWGYFEVRPGAHMFYWLYKSHYKPENSSTPWPIILWLQGGPGSSAIEFGDFQFVGPVDKRLKPRNSTWLKKADLLFVDSPVGTGFSFVDHTKLLVTTDEEAAADLTTLLINIFRTSKRLQKSSLFILGESYGGKIATLVGLSALEAIESGKLLAKLGGVLLGDSWISPVDYVLSWAPLLFEMSRLDNIGLEKSNSLALVIKDQIDHGLYANATNSWSQLEDTINKYSNVSFYNILLDNDMELISSDTHMESFMNSVIRKKLKIIPHDVKFGAQSGQTFDAMNGDFMKSRIHEVDKLLQKGVYVNVYNGQLDVICATKGTLEWMKKLQWEGLDGFLRSERKSLFSKKFGRTTGFVKSFRNLRLFLILGAGHFVAADQPSSGLQMVSAILGSPNDS